eukprot:214562-Chlamydomonas_euryale.AAC.4
MSVCSCCMVDLNKTQVVVRVLVAWRNVKPHVAVCALLARQIRQSVWLMCVLVKWRIQPRHVMRCALVLHGWSGQLDASVRVWHRLACETAASVSGRSGLQVTARHTRPDGSKSSAATAATAASSSPPPPSAGVPPKLTASMRWLPSPSPPAGLPSWLPSTPPAACTAVAKTRSAAPAATAT